MTKKVTKVGFWGVRGSTPTVDRSTWRYGGNTPCVEVRGADGTRFILDCGTGMRMLGKHHMEVHGQDPFEAHIFVTHYHWDHIQGIPFFSLMYSEKNRFHFYSFPSRHLGGGSVKQVLEAQMAYPYFPVDISVMRAQREFSEINGGDRIEINGTRITARWLNHPQGCLGFRVETPAGTVVYATDNEPGNPKLDENLRELAAGADIFINDAQYTPEQLATTRKGWGHSTWLEGVKIAQDVGARNLVLFHHDPDSTDRAVDKLLRDARQKYATVWAALEGMVITLGEEKVDLVMRSARTGQRRKTNFRASVSGLSEEGKVFEEETLVRDLSLQGASLHLRNCPRLQSELRVTIESAMDGGQSDRRIHLRGYVIRREPGPEKDVTAVGVIFTEEIEPPALE